MATGQSNDNDHRTERTALQAEIDALQEEFDRLLRSTPQAHRDAEFHTQSSDLMAKIGRARTSLSGLMRH